MKTLTCTALLGLTLLLCACKPDYMKSDWYEREMARRHVDMSTEYKGVAAVLVPEGTDKLLKNELKALRIITTLWQRAGKHEAGAAHRLEQVADANMYAGRHERCIYLYHVLLDIHTDHYGEEHLRTARFKLIVAFLYLQFYDLDNARRYAVEALETLETRVGRERYMTCVARAYKAWVETLAGNIETGQDDMAQALDDLRKLKGAEDEFVSVYRTSAFMLILGDNINGSIARCDEILAVWPENEEAYVTRGVAHYFSSDYEKALSDLRTVELYKSDFETTDILFIWLCLQQLNRPDEANEEVANFLGRLEKEERGYFGHRMMGFLIGENTEAEMFDSAVESYAPAVTAFKSEAHMAVGLKRYFQGDLTGAKESLRKSVEIQPYNSLTRYLAQHELARINRDETTRPIPKRASPRAPN